VYELYSSQKKLAKMTELRTSERKGRTKAEQQLRKKLSQKKEISFNPVGFVESAFRDRRGVPRQGCLSKVQSRIKFEPATQPGLSLRCLKEFSHLWIIFVFHKNTNRMKQMPRGLVRPPRLNGKKVGSFSCRTPHRHNPIGLSLTRLVDVDLSSGVIVVEGLDCVNGTPVIDIKPYVHGYDSQENSLIPIWVSDDNNVLEFQEVQVSSDEVREKAKIIFEEFSTSYFDTFADLWDAVLGILKTDIRSYYQRQKLDGNAIYEVNFDFLKVKYKVNAKENTISIIEVLSWVEEAQI